MPQIWPVGKFNLGAVLPAAPVFPRTVLDPDAASYISSVESADGQPLESQLRYCIENFILGLKGYEIWSKINNIGLLAGPRTIAGCAIPLKGATPIFNGFDNNDINRKTGVIGDGSSKYVNSNVLLTSEYAGTESHVLARIIRSTLTNSAYIGANGSSTSQGAVAIKVGSTATTILQRVLEAQTSVNHQNTLRHDADGVYGISRTVASGWRIVYPNLSSSGSATLVSNVAAQPVYVFANNNNGTANEFSNGRIGLYSLGGSLDQTELGNYKIVVDRYFSDISSLTLS